MQFPEVPGAVRWIARTLEEAGFETWAVGGAVRDALAGRPVGDWDLTTRATPPDMQRLFHRTIPVGIDHGTVGILSREGTLYEVTTFRRDVLTTGRHAVVAFAQTLDEDLSRRDFTINAVAWHPLREVLHDPFGGAGDMQGRLLRTVGDPAARFSEDYLRVLRALRFAGVFRLQIEAATWRALVGAVESLGILSPERMREEMDKILAKDETPSGALALYAASGALRALYPELDRMRGAIREGGVVTSSPGERPRRSERERGDWFSHTLRTLDLLSGSGISLKWVALLHGVGSPESFSDDPPFPEIPGARTLLRSAALLVRLRSSNARIREVSELARAASLRLALDAPDAELRRWLAMADRSGLAPILRIWEAEARADELHGADRGSSNLHALSERLRAIALAGDPLVVGELAIGGKDLVRMGFRPGPHFGDVLDHLLELVLDDPTRNEPTFLMEEAQRWLRAHGIQTRGVE